jgi:hypothetical protein
MIELKVEAGASGVWGWTVAWRVAVGATGLTVGRRMRRAARRMGGAEATVGDTAAAARVIARWMMAVAGMRVGVGARGVGAARVRAWAPAAGRAGAGRG